MKNLINTLRIAFLLVFSTTFAQQDTNYSLYRYTMNVINPAYAGANSERIEFITHVRNSWSGVEGAPETQSFNLSTPISDRLGMGLSVINDKVFIESELDVFIDFSYRLQLSENTNLNLGLKVGGSSYHLDTQGLNGYRVKYDPTLWKINKRLRPNVGIGAYLKKDNYFISFSIPKLLNSRALINDTSDSYIYSKDNKSTYLSGGYNFMVKNIQFKPSLMAIYTNGAPLSLDLTTAVRIIDKLEVGLSYRTDNAFSGLFMIDLLDWMNVGYAYETSARREIIKVSGGSHEFLFRLLL